MADSCDNGHFVAIWTKSSRCANCSFTIMAYAQQSLNSCKYEV